MPAEFSGEKLRDARRRKNITQEVLAEKADLGDRYIRDLESGRMRNPSAVLVCQMSQALDIQMDELMDIKQENDGKAL